MASLSPSHIKMGLGRVQDALSRLGNPQKKFAALHVAGTNGKGSTCVIAASCLSTRYRTGLYTSPHLVKPNERIRIDGQDISDALLGERVAHVVTQLGVNHELTYFELLTLVAFFHFAEEGLPVAVIETGLGGRLDATTACVPHVTAITPIDFDHQQFLGDSLSSIAREKAGILKAGIPLISSRQSAAVLSVLEQAVSGTFWLEEREFSVQQQPHGLYAYRGVTFGVSDLSLGLKGPHQRQNLAVALASMEAMTQFPLHADEVKRGVALAKWPGRFEVFSGIPPIVIDGAHNPAGVVSLVSALASEFPQRPLHLVFGVFADKDVEPMVRALFPVAETIHLVPVDSPRALAPSTLHSLASALHSKVYVHSSAHQGLNAACAEASSDGVVVVAGSLHLVGELRPLLAAQIRSGC